MEHIHNVIPDPYRKCLWIFSGDFGDNAAIWKVTENFGKVERAFYGDQKYRACVVHALPDGLLYATDSPLDKDYIFLLNPDTGELKEIMPIAGSCIYGCKWKGALTAIWQFCRYLFWPQWGSQCRRVQEKYERMLEEGRVNK